MITKETIDKMKVMRWEGKTYVEIAKEFKTTPNAVAYHLDEQMKIKAKQRASASWARKKATLTEKEIRKIYKNKYKKIKGYIMKRYRMEPEFRKRYIQYVTAWQKKRKKEFEKQGLCNLCGNKLDDKFVTCSDCRAKRRKAKRRKWWGDNDNERTNKKRKR